MNGFSIKHYSRFVINGNAEIGDRCTVFHGVTIDRSFYGKSHGGQGRE